MNTPLHSPYITDTPPKEKTETNQMPAADARIKQFFLEEARILCPATNIHCSDYSKLYALYQRLKRLVRLFTLFYEHNWGEIIPDTQRAFGFYLVEGYASKKDRLRITELLAKQMGFVTQAAQFNDFIGILQQHYSSQVSEIERILHIYYKPEHVDPFPTIP